jgi:hypothetical protein
MTAWSETVRTAVRARPVGIWTWAYDLVRGPALIKVEASGQWTYSAGRQCGPDGDLTALLNSRYALVPDAPFGALLIKIGGSTAGVRDGDVRVAGSTAVIRVEDGTAAPVLLTINDELSGLGDNDGELIVTMSIAALPRLGS